MSVVAFVLLYLLLGVLTTVILIYTEVHDYPNWEDPITLRQIFKALKLKEWETSHLVFVTSLWCVCWLFLALYYLVMGIRKIFGWLFHFLDFLLDIPLPFKSRRR
jgi:hypothetical protein